MKEKFQTENTQKDTIQIIRDDGTALNLSRREANTVHDIVRKERLISDLKSTLAYSIRSDMTPEMVAMLSTQRALEKMVCWLIDNEDSGLSLSTNLDKAIKGLLFTDRRIPHRIEQRTKMIMDILSWIKSNKSLTGWQRNQLSTPLGVQQMYDALLKCYSTEKRSYAAALDHALEKYVEEMVAYCQHCGQSVADDDRVIVNGGCDNEYVVCQECNGECPNI